MVHVLCYNGHFQVGKIFNRLYLCVCVFLFIPTDYPPPPPPVEDSAGFPTSPVAFPPPPINSYDYQVRECVHFPRLSVECEDSNELYTKFMHQVQYKYNAICPLELQPTAGASSSRCCL